MHPVEESHCIKGVITHPRQKRAITPYRSEACLPLNKELCVMLRGLSLLPLLDELRKANHLPTSVYGIRKYS